MNDADFLRLAFQNPVNQALFERLRYLNLPDAYLTAGCLFQSMWNIQTGRLPTADIKDYDVFYFSPDTSWDAEDRVIRRVAEATADLGATVEVKNQARVHLWYRNRFGSDYPQLTSSQDGINRYPVRCTCVGIQCSTGLLHAPDGYADLSKGLLRMNPLNAKPDLFLAKAQHYKNRWPWLTIVPHR